MKFIIFPLLILYIICSSPPHIEVNIKEIISRDMEIENQNLKKRRLSTGYAVYSDPEAIITFYNDCVIESLNVHVKAVKGELTSFYLPSAVADNIILLSSEIKMKDDKGNEITTYSKMTNCTASSSSLNINTYLPENYELIVKASFKGFTSQMDAGFLYQQILIRVPTFFKNTTHCKYIFNVDSNSANIGLENGLFPVFNDSAYIYDDLCPNSFSYDFLRVSARQIIWNSYTKVTVDLKEIEPNNPDTIMLAIPFNFENGTNFDFTKKISYTPLKNGNKRNDTFYQNYNFYYIEYYNFEKPQLYYFIKDLTFSSSPNNWLITDEIIKEDLKNTSTTLTISKVKEILENDNSDMPDYYKIGKWVYTNIKYDYDHNTESNPDDILQKKRGVCHHFTVLYNALLNSIGIKALYASGATFKNIQTLKGENHAWTVAEINGKWIGLDATWNIFSGRLPQCHLFRKTEGSFEPFGIVVPIENTAKTEIIDEIKLIEIVNISSSTFSENKNEYLKIIPFNFLVLIILLFINF